MATDEQLNRALLVFALAKPEACDALIRERHTDAQVAAWLERELKFTDAQVAYLAPILREALDGMTPAGAARKAARSRQGAA